jgi:hypothetical protein
MAEVSEIDALTNELESVIAQIAALEIRRQLLVWKRNQALVENASRQNQKEEVHIGGIRVS